VYNVIVNKSPRKEGVKMTTGERLRKLRGAKTREKVAADLDISYSMYIKLERDERKASDDMKIRIANYYGKSIEYIFFGAS
jgi:transcriptional regulator with XRE-family HTH domain